MAVRNKILFLVTSFSAITFSLILEVFSYPLSGLLAELLCSIFHGTNYQLFEQSSIQFIYLTSQLIFVGVTFGILLLFNLISRKKGRAEGCISPAYAFAYTAASSISSLILSFLFTDLLYILGFRHLVGSIYSIRNIAQIIVFPFVAVIFCVILFITGSKRARQLNQRVLEGKENSESALGEAKLFSAGRIVVLVVFVIAFSVNWLNPLSFLAVPYEVFNIINYLVYPAFIVLCFAAVIICNLIAGKKNPQNKIPLATAFIPIGASMVSSIINYFIRAVFWFLKAFEVKEQYGYDGYYYYDEFYNEFVNKTNAITGVTTFIAGIITVVLFTILVFRHEKKNYEAMLNDKYYGKKKEKPAPAPVQNAPQAQGQPVYGQPVQVVYLQPGQIIPGQPVQIVYQQPDQPVYGQPVQVVYQQPVQPDNTVNTSDEPTIIMNDDATAVMNSDSFTTNGNNNNQ